MCLTRGPLFTRVHPLLQECTAFLLDVLAEDKPDQGFLQTRLLELNLMGGAPQVRETDCRVSPCGVVFCVVHGLPRTAGCIQGTSLTLLSPLQYPPPLYTQVAHAILGSGMFHHFDKTKVAALCERAGLSQRALELYSDTKDIKRVLSSSAQLDPAFLISYFANLTPDQVLDCLA